MNDLQSQGPSHTSASVTSRSRNSGRRSVLPAGLSWPIRCSITRSNTSPPFERSVSRTTSRCRPRPASSRRRRRRRRTRRDRRPVRQDRRTSRPPVARPAGVRHRHPEARPAGVRHRHPEGHRARPSSDAEVVVTLEAGRVNHGITEAVPADHDEMAACDPEAAIRITKGQGEGHEVLQRLNDPADGGMRVEKTDNESAPPQRFRIDGPGCTGIRSLRSVQTALSDRRPITAGRDSNRGYPVPSRPAVKEYQTGRKDLQRRPPDRDGTRGANARRRHYAANFITRRLATLPIVSTDEPCPVSVHF